MPTENEKDRIHVHTGTLTHHSDKNHETVKVDGRPIRLSQNREYIKNKNVKAFLYAISWAEGGDYDFKYGAIKGKKNDPWRFTDFSTHPGFGKGGSSTASGMYQITKATWEDHGIKGMGLSDFGQETQDLIAVSILRRLGAIDDLLKGDFSSATSKASHPWAALEYAPNKGNRHTKQPYRNMNQLKKNT